MRLGNMEISAAMQGRGNNGENPPWFGFYYGSWVPQFWSRGNHLFKEYNWYWLCFHGGITVWSNQ